MELLLLVTFVFCVIIGYYLIWGNKSHKKYLKNIKGPPPLPILGNALELRSSTLILPAFMRFQEEYNGIALISAGPVHRQLVISDYKFLEFLLTSTSPKLLDKAHEYKYLNRWLGTGLLTSDSEKWKKHRKLITPAFHFQILEQYIEVFDSASNILVQKLSKEVGQASTDIYHYVTLCTLDIICEAAMGASVDAQENSEAEYVKSVAQMCRIQIVRSFSPLKQFNLLYRFSLDYLREKKALKILHNYTNSVIATRKAEILARKDSNPEYQQTTEGKKKLAFLDLLLQYNFDENGLLSDSDIREEVDTFMFEGHDTTGSAISFILFCLSNHPEVQARVFDEIQLIFGNEKDRPTTHRDLQEMKYLEAVIKETLRLYPSVPFYARNIREDVEYNGSLLPKDLTLIIFAYGMNRRPEYYPDPEKFDPERFLGENTIGRPPYSYLAFSAGPRNCIGQKFAMLEMKAVVSKVLRNYELLPVIPRHELLLAAETVLKSANGILLRLKEREYS